jgi:DNA-directed RNA polymerase beta' subunit
VPNDLINFCIRVPINKEKLIEKNISLEEICFKLQETYPFLFIVNTSENADTIILRLYIRSMFFKKSKETQINQIVKFIKIKLNETVIRGINGIVSTNTENNIARSYIDETGTIKNKILPIITTSGTNLDTIFENDFIDPYNTFSNSIIEIQETLGIEAARTMIINEIRNMIPTVNIRHYMMYADEMTSTGIVTAIEKSGIDKRNPNDVLLSMSNSHPVQIGESAAINNIKTNVNQSLSASLMTGRVPKFGSLYNKAIYNESFISENN